MASRFFCEDVSEKRSQLCRDVFRLVNGGGIGGRRPVTNFVVTKALASRKRNEARKGELS